MGGGPPVFMPNSTCSALLRIRRNHRYISNTGLLPYAVRLSKRLLLYIFDLTGVQNPKDKSLVWALPISLAATLGIDFSFSSSGYLDVSVPRVSSNSLIFQLSVRTHDHTWVTPFGNLRVEGYLHLTAAYRSLSRPSSAPSAKASALCSFSLDLK